MPKWEGRGYNLHKSATPRSGIELADTKTKSIAGKGRAGNRPGAGAN